MAIRSQKNEYRGINAHLNSYLQNAPGNWWETFHGNYIADIRAVVDTLLPSGYYAINERSLQIRDYGVSIGYEHVRLVKPDVSIYGTDDPQRIPIPSSLVADDPSASVAAKATLGHEDYYRSVLVSSADAEGNLKPVTQIELLSPSNKPPDSGYLHYLTKRGEALASGINLIEIDFLHQSRSPIPIVPAYPLRESDSAPYLIIVNDLRPGMEAGTTHFYRFAVDDLIPKIAIPLIGTDEIVVDFGEVYNRTFDANRYYHEVAVDYEQLPMKFETYSPDDQARIAARMAAVAEKARA